MESAIDEQNSDGKLPVMTDVVSPASAGGAVRQMTKRVIKGYFAVSEVMADVRENLSDVYAEAKHEYYGAKTVAPGGSATSASGEETASHPNDGSSSSDPQATTKSGAQRSWRGRRLIRALLERTG